MLLNRIAVKLAFFLNGFVFANWVSRLPRIQEQYQADNKTIGFILLALSVGAVTAMPFTGWLIIKNGSRKITLISLFIYCAFVPLIPFMSGIATVILLFVVLGVSTGMLDVAMNAQAVMVEKTYKRPIMTSFHAFWSIGMALGALCGALFADFRAGLPVHLITVAVVALATIIWIRSNLVEDKPEITDVPDGPLFRMPNRALLSVGIIAFCCMLGEGAISDWSVMYMEKIALSPKALAPIALAAFGTAMTLGRLVGDRFRIRWGDKKLIVFGGLLATAGMALTLSFPLPYTSIVGFFLVGLGLAAIVPITYSIAGNSKDLPSGVGLAMVTTVGYTGFLFGPPIIGFLSDLSDLRLALVVVAILFLLMTIVGLAHKPEKTTDPGL